MTMRIGVLSDTHGSELAAERAAARLPDAEAWIHLGDGMHEAALLERLTGKPVHRIKGNCDYGPGETERVLTLGGVSILAVHGHLYGVQNGRDTLSYRAEELGCKLALYGHTHVSLVEAWGGILLVNPGSAARPKEGRAPSIALVELRDGDAFPSILTI